MGICENCVFYWRYITFQIKITLCHLLKMNYTVNWSKVHMVSTSTVIHRFIVWSLCFSIRFTSMFCLRCRWWVNSTKVITINQCAEVNITFIMPTYVLRSCGISWKSPALIVRYSQKKKRISIVFYCSENPSIAHNLGTTGPIEVGFSAKCTSPNECFSQIENW